MRGRLLVIGSAIIIVVALAVVFVTRRDHDLAPVGPPLSTKACLRRPDPKVVTGVQTDQLKVASPPASLTVDLRTAVFTGFPDRTLYPISIGKGSPGRGLCLVGGIVRGTQSPTLTWQQVKSRYDGAGARVAGNDWYVVDGLRVENVEDGIDPRGTDGRYPKDGDGFILRNLYFRSMRDDCIENDDIAGGLVEDSLFDGCYTGISERPTSGNPQFQHPAPPHEELQLRHVLLRLEAQAGPRGHSAAVRGHGQLFKWSDVGNRLHIEDSILLVEQTPNRGRADFPPRTIARNVTVVWLGGGRFPGVVPPGVRITTDRGVWDRARTTWLDRHGCRSFDKCSRLIDPAAS